MESRFTNCGVGRLISNSPSYYIYIYIYIYIYVQWSVDVDSLHFPRVMDNDVKETSIISDLAQRSGKSSRLFDSIQEWNRHPPTPQVRVPAAASWL